MATMRKRRNGDGSTSWDATVRIVGYPTIARSFHTKIKAELWASRTEAAAKGGTLASARGLTLGNLIDEALPRLIKPTAVAFAYWREHLGDVRLVPCEINAAERAAKRICRATYETTSIKSISPRSRARHGSGYPRRLRAR